MGKNQSKDVPSKNQSLFRLVSGNKNELTITALASYYNMPLELAKYVFDCMASADVVGCEQFSQFLSSPIDLKLLVKLSLFFYAGSHVTLNKGLDCSLHKYESFKEYIQSFVLNALTGKPYPKQTIRSDIISEEQILYLQFQIQSIPSSQLLFSTAEHGSSFTTFYTRSKDYKLLLILQDEDLNTFGAYLSDYLIPKPNFYGHHSTFLFDLSKEWNVYQSHNDHYQYFNVGAQSLPNGLGVGGQIGYFGLWIDADFGKGENNECATFQSPRITKQRDFKFKKMEAWAIGEKRPTEEDEEEGGGALSNEQANTLMEMAGKQLYSKQVRDVN